METMGNALKNATLAKRVRWSALEALRSRVMKNRELGDHPEHQVFVVFSTMNVVGWSAGAVKLVHSVSETFDEGTGAVTALRIMSDELIAHRREHETESVEDLFEVNDMGDVRLLAVGYCLGAHSMKAELQNQNGELISHGPGFMVSILFPDLETATIQVAGNGMAVAVSSAPLPISYVLGRSNPDIMDMLRNAGNLRVDTNVSDSTIEIELARYMGAITANSDELRLI